jgi:hypothetical protein
MINPAPKPSHLNRREALQTVGATVALATVAGAAGAATTAINASDRHAGGFWPNGARLAMSLSLMFEGGGQPISGAGGVIPDPIEKGVPDLPTNAFFAYGHYEGIPRMLDLMDKHGIKLSSFMIEGGRNFAGYRSGNRATRSRGRCAWPGVGQFVSTLPR